jgi:hypothetical protein
MTDFIVSLLLLFQIKMGHAAYYAEHRMEEVVHVRQAGLTAQSLPTAIPDGIVGFVALPDCRKIGSIVWLWHESEGLSGPYLVADCANQIEGHNERMMQRDIIVEVDHNTATRWGVLGLGPEDIQIAIISYR